MFSINLFLFEDHTSSAHISTAGGSENSPGVIIVVVGVLILSIIGVVMLIMWKRSRNEKEIKNANEQSN